MGAPTPRSACALEPPPVPLRIPPKAPMLGGDPVITPSLACCAVFLAVVLLAQPVSAAGKRDNTPPSTPTNVRVVAVTEDSITFAWNASTDNSGRIHAYIAGGIYHPADSTTRTDGWL